jgi:gamma-glutamyltranspeptidase / glutathione hydrolase / leukotriene-C4 hydrolase
VASENGICSTIGTSSLKNGGNAVDATIAIALCLGVTNSYSSGIGGGGFMMIRNPEGHVDIIDMREVAPSNATAAMFEKDPQLSLLGGLSIAVPGELRGLYDAYKRYGKLPWASLVEPAIQVAQDGFVVGSHCASILKAFEKTIMKDSYFSKVFAPNGTLAVQGETIRMPVFAQTLRQIANEGIDVFYEGSLADWIISTIKSHGGSMTHEDLRNYTTILRSPIRTEYHNYRVISAPVPASGPVAAFILNILDQFPGNRASSDKSVFYQQLVEALKYGFSRRTRLSDPEFAGSNLTSYVKNILEPSYAKEIASKIQLNRTFDWQYYEPDFDVTEDHGTTHISILDKNGMSVAFTSSINHLFGSQIVTNTGIILNNHMNDFSIHGSVGGYNISPSPMNFISPGKRPLTSSCPTLLEDNDGNLRVVLGASGGSRIISAVIQTIVNLIDRLLTPEEAVEFPRLHHQLLPNIVRLEHDFPKEIINFLESINHTISLLPENVYESSAQLLTIEGTGSNRLIRAWSDSRRTGRPAGY